MPALRPHRSVAPRRLLALAALLLGGASLFARPLEPGAKAPPLAATEWEGGTLNAGDTEGKVVALFFFSTQVPKIESKLGQLGELAKRYEGKALVVAVTKEPRERVREFVKQKGLQLGCHIAIDGEEAIWDGFGITGYPYCTVVNPYGEVAWTGSSRQFDVFREELEEACGEVLSYRVDEDETDRRFKKAWRDLRRGDYAKAIAELKRIEKRGSEEEKVHARTLLEDVGVLARSRMKRVETLAARRSYVEAEALLRVIERRFKGLPEADEADAQLKRWKKDKQVQAEIKAALLLERAAELEDNRQRDAAIDIYRAITARFGGTRAAEQAEARLAELAPPK